MQNSINRKNLNIYFTKLFLIMESVELVVELEVPVDAAELEEVVVVEFEVQVVAAELEPSVVAGFEVPVVEGAAAVDIGVLVVVVVEELDVATVELAGGIVEPVGAGEFHLCSKSFVHNEPKINKDFFE